MAVALQRLQHGPWRACTCGCHRRVWHTLLALVWSVVCFLVIHVV
jgi:hypothetical protein